MTQLTGTGPAVVAQPIFSSSSDKLHALGELTHGNDGRVFRFCKAGGTALVVGKLQSSEAEITGDQGLTAVAAAVGDLSIASTTTVTITADEYAEGWAIISVTPGVGLQYHISGHIAYTTAAPTLTLSNSSAIQVALTTTSRFDLVHNPYSAVIVSPTTYTSGPVGVAVHPLVTLEYGWLQVGGVASILQDGATAVGNFVSASKTIVGATIDLTHVSEAPVGTAMSGIADTEYGPIKINLI